MDDLKGQCQGGLRLLSTPKSLHSADLDATVRPLHPLKTLKQPPIHIPEQMGTKL
jgi:hypothetical protein